MTHFAYRAALLAGAIGLVAASTASAQESYRDTDQNGTEHVIVNAPREWMRHYPDGTVTLSREVSYADLDLATHDGARELRHRIRYTARDVCEALNDRTAADDPLNRMDVRRCAHAAFRGAMFQAHDAIHDAHDSGDEDR